MNLRALAPVGAMLMAAACSQPPPAAPLPAAAPLVAKLAPASVERPAAMRLRGSGLMGKDGYGITLCGEGSQRIVTLEPAAKAVLDSFLAGGAHEFSLDAVGDLVGMDKMSLRSIERIGTEGLGCDERIGSFSFQAHGTEPFWSLELGAAEASFTRPDQAALSGPIKDQSAADGSRQFDVDTRAGRLQVHLSPGACNDGMADMHYGWQAEASLGGETYTGCAYAGEAPASPR